MRPLQSLRSRIRGLVVIEGVAAALVLMASVFWLALALDYLPVQLGFNELSWWMRAAILAATVAGSIWLLYRFIFNRVFVAMPNRSMALLIEREYPQFEESLLTCVDAAGQIESDIPVDRRLLDAASRQASSHINQIDLGRVVSARPAIQKSIAATIVMVPAIAMALAAPATMKRATNRMIWLDNEPWPRHVRLELAGIKIIRENAVPGIAESAEAVVPIEGVVHVARGSSATLLVRGRVNDPQADEASVPQTCSMRYWSVGDSWSSNGQRGSQVLSRVGNLRDGWQTYSLTGSPLTGMTDDLRFEIRGGDKRIGPFTIEVVSPPVVNKTTLGCTFPDYLVDEASMRWTARDIDWTGPTGLPQGTQFSIKGTATKPLVKMYVSSSASERIQLAEVDGREFSFLVNSFAESGVWQFYALDADRVLVDEPHVVTIEAIEDAPPEVKTRLDGIGIAVTADAVIPVTGSVSDDYGVRSIAATLTTPAAPVMTLPQLFSPSGGFSFAIDLRQLRTETGLELPTGDDAELSLVVEASDGFNLNGADANVGVGDRYTLEIVSRNRLLKILEQLEVGQRRRLEQVSRELAEVKSWLIRTRRTVVDPEELNADPVAANRMNSKRVLFGQRAGLQVRKSTGEITGVARTFDNVYRQLINNRIDSEDRKERLRDRIVAPLDALVTGRLETLSLAIDVLNESLESLNRVAGVELDDAETQVGDQVSSALAMVDQAVADLDQVLSILLKFETQNELLDLVRNLIAEQKDVLEKTGKQRRQKAFEGLLE